MYDTDIMRLRFCGLLPKARSAYSLHAHDTYEFHYIVGGRGAFEVRRRQISILPGCFFYTRPRTKHRSAGPTDGSYLLQYVAFLELDPRGDAAIVADLEARVGEGALRRLGDRYHGFFAQISRLSEADDPWERRAATFRFTALLYELMGGETVSDQGHPAVEGALEFMRSHVDEAFDLDEIVASVGLDKSYFIRLFKKSVGVPPMRYATNLKMTAAANLLHTTQEPLATVAAQVGFSDEYHFAKRFKQWSGSPPGAYRRRG
jgi:AraC-like DNA-binding protein/mannose-6-phosphate isomerase-like protein (cupin superfamily)